MNIEKMKEMFGEEFVQKYQKARNRSKGLTEDKLKEILKFVKEHLGETEDFLIKYDKWDCLLVDTPGNEEMLTPKAASNGNWRIPVAWLGDPSGGLMSLFAPDKEIIQEMTESPNMTFIAIGKLRQTEYQGQPSYTLNVVAVKKLATLLKEE